MTSKHHAPPPIAWRNAGKDQTIMQPMRAFSPLQRPQDGRKAGPGDELVSLSNGLFQLRGHDSHILSRPSGLYNFVRVQGATRNQAVTMLSSKAPHAALADGRPVLYAGTAAFEGGSLQWWSNYSGTYQPQAEFNRQAALPPDRFVPWQRLQLGGVGLQRGMLSDLRGSQAPATAKPQAKAVEAPKAPEKTEKKEKPSEPVK